MKVKEFRKFCSEQARIFCWMKELVTAQIHVRLTETKGHCGLKGYPRSKIPNV